jgi:predicted O-methyltransferase YrrM
MSASIEAPQSVLQLLDKLHQTSLDEENALKASAQSQPVDNTTDTVERNRIRDEAMKDKFIALDADKAAFMYNLVRAIGATNIVEAGTSYGVSTIYLALAVGQNAQSKGKKPGEAKVIATEHWHEKAERARAYWKEAGESVEPWIDLREGDILQTLKKDMPTVDLVLFDIWAPLAAPTLDVVLPNLRSGAVILADNVTASGSAYDDFFARLKGPNSKFKTMTLPFAGGLEMATYWP